MFIVASFHLSPSYPGHSRVDPGTDSTPEEDLGNSWEELKGMFRKVCREATYKLKFIGLLRGEIAECWSEARPRPGHA